ncbi:sugar transferase [Wenyingzhuangia aestuarii]|uniref:sugar transferase n=1 Tax=Wenyingzhuangia aestuarii TaxID=1647582 RepID=UPI001438F682|nr:sugar transferase [Wenyingzhuangia aestuarii]NJB83247.1 lipopolysaccharide/colanic/teichoic acid biosynthesis glycosyltransferase [Wenyingzhuangia aestuarii]
MLSKKQRIYKRTVDLIGAFIGLVVLGIPIIVLALVVYLKTGENGFFLQQRVGQRAKLFWIIKIKTMYKSTKLKGYAAFLRKSKLDELPQLLNILKGEMSIVGPRPDIVGFADKLKGEERLILELKPGLTGPASLHFYNEEQILSKQKDKEKFNKEIIWREKIRINMNYIKRYTLANDFKYLYLSALLFVKGNRNFKCN